MSQTRKGRRERKSELIAVATEIVAELGVEQLSVKSLAERCSVSSQLVYAYFGNLTELQRQVLCAVFDERRADLDRRLSDVADLRQWVEAYVRSDFESAKIGSVIAQLEPIPGVGSVLNELRAQEWSAKGRRIFAVVADEVALSQAAIELLLNVSAGGLLSGATYVWRNDVDIEAAVAAAVEFIMAGLTAVDTLSPQL